MIFRSLQKIYNSESFIMNPRLDSTGEREQDGKMYWKSLIKHFTFCVQVLGNKKAKQIIIKFYAFYNKFIKKGFLQFSLYFGCSLWILRARAIKFEVR